MRGRRPTPSSFTLPLRSTSLPPLLARSTRLGNHVCSTCTLTDARRPLTSVNPATPPAFESIRSTHELHTTLLGFAQAATPPSPATRESTVAHSSTSSDTKPVSALNENGVEAAAGELRTHSAQAETGGGGGEAAAAGGSERHLLQRLLLHRRHRLQRANRTAEATSSSLCATARPTAASGTEESQPLFSLPAQSAASWTRAFELFSEAVRQHHVSPTAQHFNLLLYIAQQHRLWARMDAVEEFQAHLLASVQQLIAEKKKEQRSGRANITAGAEVLLDADESGRSALRSAPRAIAPTETTSVRQQVNELREMEAALLPNAQTYELLLSAALARGSWSRALEYCDMRTRSGVGVMTDTSVRQVLQVYALAQASAVTEPAAAHARPPTPPPQRLRTDQQGPGLRAAAQPRLTSSSASSSSSLSAFSGISSRTAETTSPSSAPQPLWSVALRFFRGSLHRVTSMQTVWCVVELLQSAGQQHEVLHLLTNECRGLLEASQFALATRTLGDALERRALLRTLRAMSDAAREVGDWQVALSLLRDVVELRRQLSYARSATAAELWGAPAARPELMQGARVATTPSSSSRSSAARSLPTLASIAHPQGEMVSALRRDEEATVAEADDEVRLSQLILQNTLHTLRRVRRYADMVQLYQRSPHHPQPAETGGGGTEAGRVAAPAAGEAAMVWRTTWTPAAVAFVAQAALATRHLDLLLELCGCGGDAADSASEKATAEAPADAYDAALRLLQSRILQHCVRVSSSSSSDSTLTEPQTGASANAQDAGRYVSLSQRVYRAYRSRALTAVADDEGGRTLPPAVLTDTHAPLVRMLAQSLRTDTPLSTLAAQRQDALKHFQRTRHPDTLTVALTLDVLRSQTARLAAPTSVGARLSDADGMAIVLGVQQVLNAVLGAARLDPVRLCTLDGRAFLPHAAEDMEEKSGGGGGGAGHTSAFGLLSREASPAVPETKQLAAVAVVTSAATLISFDILSAVQPLLLLRFIPTTVRVGWLPPHIATVHLQHAQRTTMEWTAARLAEQAAAATAQEQQQQQQQQTRAAPGVHHQKPLATPSVVTSSRRPRHDLETSSGEAVKAFVRLYAQHSVAAMPSITATAAHQQTSVNATHAAVVLSAAAHALSELQRRTVAHPPTAAMAAFLHTLQRVWTARARRRSGAPDAEFGTAGATDELEAAVVAAVNALLQQIGASSLSRWTLWGDCADLLGRYVCSPLPVSPPQTERHTERQPSASLQQQQQLAPTVDTLRVLRGFLRQCDKAEAPFVEYVALRWLLRLPQDGDAAPTVSVQALCALCTTSEDALSPVVVEAMLLLLEAVAWACRRHDRPLARHLYATLRPWIDLLISQPAATTQSKQQQQQLAQLHDVALSVYMTLLQGFSSGPRPTVLQDWPMQMHVLRQLTQHARLQIAATARVPAAPHLALSNDGCDDGGLDARLHSTAALVEGLALVAVRLQRTLHFLLTGLALDAHRAVYHASANARYTTPPPKLPPAPAGVEHHQQAVERAAEEWSEWCAGELVASLLLSTLRVSVECAAASRSRGDAAHTRTSACTAALLGALRKVADSIWELDFVAFVWYTEFPPLREKAGATSAVLSAVCVRGLQLLTLQLQWFASDTAALAHSLRLWLLFSTHALHRSASPTEAVAALCRDVTTLEVSYAFNVTPNTEAAATPSAQPFLHLVIEQIDSIVEAVLTRAAAAETGGVETMPDAAVSSYRASLPPMDLVTRPLLHFALPHLRLLQHTGQQLLYLSLCEGVTDVSQCQQHQQRSGTLQRSEGTVNAAASPLPPSLLRRCLAWPGQSSAYPVLLRAVEATAHEALRASRAVADVLQHMARLHRAEAALALLLQPGLTSGQAEKLLPSARDSPACNSAAETFLGFFLGSATLRRASPVSAPVCLAALLACAAEAASSVGTGTSSATASAAPPLPRSLVTLLRAFPFVLTEDVYAQWECGNMTVQQEKVVRSWALVCLWGGTQDVCSSRQPAASLPEALAEAMRAYRQQSAVVFPLPLRRAAMQYLLLTQGSLLPDEARVTSAAEMDLSRLCGPEHTALCISEAAEVLSRCFPRLVHDTAGAKEALSSANRSVRKVFADAALAVETAVSLRAGEEAARAALVSGVIDTCATRHAVEHLIKQYSRTVAPTANGEGVNTATRLPALLGAAEREALIRQLPAEARAEARQRLSSTTDTSTTAAALSESTSMRDEPWAAAIEQRIAAMTSSTHGKDTTRLRAQSVASSHKEGQANDSAETPWTELYDAVALATQEALAQGNAGLGQRGGDVQGVVDGWQRRSALRRQAEALARRGASLHLAGRSADAAELSACVKTVLLYTLVYAPTAHGPTQGQSGGMTALAAELLWLLSLFSVPLLLTSAAPLATDAHMQYEWLVQHCVQPLMTLTASTDGTERVRATTTVSESTAASVVVMHHLSAVVRVLVGGTQAATSAGDSDTHTGAALLYSASLLFRKTSEDVCALFSDAVVSSDGGAMRHVPPLVRAWMQAGVLLGEGDTLLWACRRLTTHLLQQRYLSAPTRDSHKAATVVAWLCVLPIAVTAVHSCTADVSATTTTTQDKDRSFEDLLTVLPLPECVAPLTSPSYASTLRFWREQMRQRATAVPHLSSVSPDSTALTQYRSYLRRLAHVQPLSVVWSLSPPHSQPADHGALRALMATCLSGPSTEYAALHSLRRGGELDETRGVAGSSLAPAVSAAAPLTSECLCAAMRCVEKARKADMQAFVQLESTKSGPRRGADNSEASALRLATMQRGKEVQAAWRVLERAAVHQRQRTRLTPATETAAAAPAPLVPLSEWTRFFLSRSVVWVPHTVHFVRPSLTEVLMLESCVDWAEGVRVLRHSLESLQRTGATPVQQYMAQLLLQRLRLELDATTQKHETDGSGFTSGLADYAYTVHQQQQQHKVDDLAGMWHRSLSGHTARGAAALVCRVVDLLLESHVGHTRPTSQAPAQPLAQHTLREALRCSVHDLAVSRGLFSLFWAHGFRRVEGAHAVLSALRAAKLARSEPLAVQAILTYLWVTTTADGGSAPRAELWRLHVLRRIDVQADTHARVVLADAARDAQDSTSKTYALSSEAHFAIWKAWAALCRGGLASEPVALDVVGMFKAMGRVSEVEELMVTTVFMLKKRGGERGEEGG